VLCDLLDKSTKPTVDRLQLLRWLFFDPCAGNDYSHAKDLSIIATSGGLCLAPFYDLMCTRVYSSLAAKFAFAIAGIRSLARPPERISPGSPQPLV
jgi:serine/threonine-protein kinase HipA